MSSATMERTTRAPWFAEYKVDVPEGESGAWAVSRFSVSEEDAAFSRMRAAVNPRERGREVVAGKYTKLMRGRKIIMSDTPAEIRDHMEPIRRATGRVLIHGLGLGVVLKAVLAKPDVTHVDVVDQSADVLALVSPHYACPRVAFHQGDAFTFKFPFGAVWDVAWHDIWDDLSTDNLAEMAKLHRRYARRVGWQGSWGRDDLTAARRQERRNPLYGW